MGLKPRSKDSDFSDIQSTGKKARNGLKRTTLMVALCIVVLCAVGVVVYQLSRMSENGGAIGLSHADTRQSTSVAFDSSIISLPNVWKFDANGRAFCISLDRVGEVKPGEEDCEVTVSGCVAVSDESWPCSVRIVLEPVDAAEYYVSKVRSVSIPKNKSLESEIDPLLRLYSSHLQKTMMKK